MLTRNQLLSPLNSPEIDRLAIAVEEAARAAGAVVCANAAFGL